MQNMWIPLCVLCLIILVLGVINVDAMKRHKRDYHLYRGVRDQSYNRPEASLRRMLFPVAPAQLKAKSNHSLKSNQSGAIYDESVDGIPYLGGPRRHKEVRDVTRRRYNVYRPQYFARCGQTYKETEINYSDTMKEVTKLRSECIQYINGK